MSGRFNSLGGWSLSLALHGLALGGMLALARPEAPPPMYWEVAMAMPTAETPMAAPEPASRPEPTPPAHMARPPTPPPTQPEPVAQAIPQPVAQAVAAPAPLAAPTVVASTAQLASPAADVAVPAPPRAIEAPQPKVAAEMAQPAQDSEAQKRWYAGLRAKLAELKQYPLVARRLGQEGVVVLEALVQPDGRTEVMLKRGSGHAALDRAALRLFEEAAAAMRTTLKPEQPSRLEIPVAYLLRE